MEEREKEMEGRIEKEGRGEEGNAHEEREKSI